MNTNSMITHDAAPEDTDSAVAEGLQLLETCLHAGILVLVEYEARRAKLLEGHHTSEATKVLDQFRCKATYLPVSTEVWESQPEAKRAMNRMQAANGMQLRWKFLYQMSLKKTPRTLVYRCALHVDCQVKCKISLARNGFQICQKAGTVHSHQLVSRPRANSRMTLAQEVQCRCFCLIISL